MDYPKKFTRYFYFFVALFLFSLGLRLIFFYAYTQHDFHYLLAFDSDQYHQIALKIAHGQGISTQTGAPNFYRLPGYPLFLGFLYKFFNDNVITTLAIQVVLVSIIPCLLFLLAQTLAPTYPFVAYLSGITAALHSGFILYAGILSTESLFLLFFLIFLVVFFSAVQQKRVGPFICAGIILGIASLIRPVGHYLVIVSLAVLALYNWKLRCSISFFLAWLGTISWWLLRNFILTGALFFHTLPGLHFLQYSAVYVVQEIYHCDYFQAKNIAFDEWEARCSQESTRAEKLSEHKRYAIAHTLAFEYLFAHPWYAIKHALIQIARTCGTLYSTILLYVKPGTVYPPDASLWFKIKLYLYPTVMTWWTRFVIYLELILSLFMIVGISIFLVKSRSNSTYRNMFGKTVPFALTLIVITLAYGCARLRFAVEPFLILYAACGWNSVFLRRE